MIYKYCNALVAHGLRRRDVQFLAALQSVFKKHKTSKSSRILRTKIIGVARFNLTSARSMVNFSRSP
jgi:hypothetical protein